MFKNINIKTGLLYAVVGLLSLVLIGFAENKQGEKRVKKVSVSIDRSGNNYFVEDEDVLDLMTKGGSDPIVDKKYRHLDLKEMEMRIKSFKFVKDAQVSKDYKGNVRVLVKQRRPIARVIFPNGVHAYIGSDGTTLSTSEKFTSRVMIVDGGFASNFLLDDYFQTEEGKPYFELLKLVDENKFWKTQLVQMTLDKQGEITFIPQVGKQTISFGKPERINEKLRKLQLFYSKIIPAKGWNTYESVNVKYSNQLICE